MPTPLTGKRSAPPLPGAPGRPWLRPLLAGAALCLAPKAGWAQFGTEQRLDTQSSPGTTESDNVKIARVGPTVHVVWNEATVATGLDLYYTRSTDGAATWQAPVRLDQDPGAGNQQEAVLLVEGDTVVVAWQDDRASVGLEDVYVRVSQDGGVTFGAELPISGTLAGAGDTDGLHGAIALPHVHLCFEHNAVDGTNEDAYVVSSSSSGASFGAPLRVNRPTGGAGSADIDDPRIAAVGPHAFVVWSDRRNGVGDQVHFNRSTDGGASFGSTDVRLDAAPLGADADSPKMEVSGDDLLVVWRDSREDPSLGINKVFANASVNAGATFLGEVRVDSAPLQAKAGRPKLALSGRNLVIGWVDNRDDLVNGLGDVYVRAGSLDGDVLTLGTEQRLDTATPAGSADNGRLKLAYEGSTVYALYKDSRNDPGHLNDGLYLRASGDGGSNFGPEYLVSTQLTGADDAEGNELAVSGQSVACVWVDNRNGAGAIPPNDVFANESDEILPCAPAAASLSSYNGTGINLDTLTSTAVVIGNDWTATLTPQASRGAGAWLILLRGSSSAGPVLDLGSFLGLAPAGPSELLVAGPVIANFSAPNHGGGGTQSVFSSPVPFKCSLVGNPWFAQAVVLGNLPGGGGTLDPSFSSAVNGLVGTF